MPTHRTVCLVDGSGYIFRAFYALPAMTRSDGTPVNAVYGFMNMMMNLAQDNLCSHIVVVFDAQRRNFRNDIYPAYKQNRRETPPDLIPQFPLIRRAVEALNIPWIDQEGFEADDLIATYARLATDRGWSARVISADKDLMQLKRPGVSVYDPMKKKTMTDEDVIKKFGVLPDQITDVQALMGDAIDNVPGATGVGPKTAAQLITTFGTLENLLSRLDEVPREKLRESLRRDKEQILISKKLVVLDEHVPVAASLDDFATRSPQPDKIRSFLQENNFISLQKRLPGWLQQWAAGTGCAVVSDPGSTDHVPQPENTPVENIAPLKPAYDLIQDERALQNWIAQIGDRVAIDTETTSLDVHTARLVGFSLGLDGGRACYVPLEHGPDHVSGGDLFSFSAEPRPQQIPLQRALMLLKPVLENPAIVKIGHNIKYDMHILLRAYGGHLNLAPIEDTMVMSSVLNGTRHGHGMDELAGIYLHHTTIKYTEVCGTGKGQVPFNRVPLPVARDYAAEDADITFRLYQVFSSRLEQDDPAHIYRNYDLPLIPVLCQMEQAGILVNEQRLFEAGVAFTRKLEMLTRDIYAAAGEEFNINSPAQLGVILFEKQGLPGGKRGANGSWTTDVKVLETLATGGSELAKLVLEYRGYAKLKSTYVDALLGLAVRDKRIHTTFSLTATNTGRLASSDPNLQNIPVRSEAGKEIRRAFVARSGYKLVCADYSQIELRLMAEVAGVAALKKSFAENEDIHARTASQIFHIPLAEIDADTRRRAKAINFGIIYGISAFGLSNNLGIPRAEAKAYIDAYFEQYPEIKTYMHQTEQFALANGYVLTPFGRRCFIHGLENGRTRSFALRAAINAPIQGGAADIIKRAMLALAARLKQTPLDCTLLLQVHDELVFEVAEADVPVARDIIKSVMENAVRLSVPLVADVGVGDNWKEAH